MELRDGVVRVVGDPDRRRTVAAALGELLPHATVEGVEDVDAAVATPVDRVVVATADDPAELAARLDAVRSACAPAGLVVAPATGSDDVARVAADYGAAYVPGTEVDERLADAVRSARGDDHLATLREAVADIETADSVEAVAERAVEAAVALTGAAGATFNVRNDDVVEPIAASDDRIAAVTRPYAVGEGGVGTAMATGETRVTEDLKEGTDGEPPLGLRSVVTVPGGDRCVMQILDEQPGAFDDAAIDRLELLAAAVGAALSRLSMASSLRDRRMDFETLFQAVPEPLVYAIIDEDDEPIVDRVNDAFLETFGGDRETLVGDSLDAHIVPEGREAEAKDITEYVRRGEPVEREVPRLAADGERTFRVRTEPLAGGEDAAALAMYVDVTERRSREQLLTALTEATAAIGAAATAVDVCEHVADAVDRLVGPQYYSITLAEDDVLVPTVTSENLSPEWARPRSTDVGVAGRVYRTGSPMLVDDVESHPTASATGPYRSGVVVPLGGHGTLAMLSSEEAAFDAVDLEVAQVLAAHASEALDRLASEDAVETERERFDALAESIPEPVVRARLTLDGAVVRSVNSAFVDTFGFDEEALVGRDISEFIIPPDHREQAMSFHEQLRAGEDVEAEVVRRTAGGDRTFRLHSVTMDRDQTTEAVSVYVDVTDQRRRIDALEERTERLARLAAGETDPAATAGTVDLAEAARDAWATAGAAGELSVADDLPTATGDPELLRAVFERLLAGGDPDRVAAVGPLEDSDGVYVEPGAGGTSDDEAVAGLVAAAVGWSLSTATADDGGPRYELRPE